MARYPTYERIEGIIIQGVEFGREVLHKRLRGDPSWRNSGRMGV